MSEKLKSPSFPEGLKGNRTEAECRALRATRSAGVTDTLVAALRPFASFLDAMEKMGGNFPKSGPFYTLTAHDVGEREITVDDFRAARHALQAALAVADGETDLELAGKGGMK